MTDGEGVTNDTLNTKTWVQLVLQVYYLRSLSSVSVYSGFPRHQIAGNKRGLVNKLDNVEGEGCKIQ